MDDFLLVVPFLGDFYISCHTGAYSPICGLVGFIEELFLSFSTWRMF